MVGSEFGIFSQSSYVALLNKIFGLIWDECSRSTTVFFDLDFVLLFLVIREIL